MAAGRVTTTGRTPELVEIARRLIWWKDPEAALADERRFLAQAMTLANWQELSYIRALYGDEALRSVLESAPPGVFDRRSWNYWHAKFGIRPVPPRPTRRL